MKRQLLSWAQNQTYSNKWDRLAATNKGVFVVAWVWQNDDKYTVNIFNTLPTGDALITKQNCASLQEAQNFADQELKKQGFNL